MLIMFLKGKWNLNLGHPQKKVLIWDERDYVLSRRLIPMTAQKEVLE